MHPRIIAPNRADSAQQRGGAFWWILLWVIGILAILFFCVQYHWSGAEAKLQSNVDTSIAAAAPAATTVNASISDGRDVTLTGRVDTEEQANQIVAAAESTIGTRRVFNQLEVNAADAAVLDEPSPVSYTHLTLPTKRIV